MNMNQNRTIVGTFALAAVTAVLLTSVGRAEERAASRNDAQTKISPTDRQAEALGAQFLIVPSQKNPGADGTIAVDVYAKNIENVRTVQVAVDGFDADGNALALASVSQDANRADFIFAGHQTIKAADAHLGRIGALAFSDSVSSTDAKYVGTFQFSIDDGARGTYHFSVRSKDSFMTDLTSHDLTYAAKVTTVRVGLTRPTTENR